MPSAEVPPEETEFLLAAASPRPDSQRIHRTLQKISNLDHLIALARKHGVLPLLCARLIDSNAPLPAQYASRLRDEYATNLAQNLAAASELLTLLAAFAQNGIPALPFKGVTLADSFFGKVGLRPAGDVDLLVHYRDLPRAAKILVGSGYELITPVEGDGSPLEPGKYEYHFERPSDGMIVEIRWRLTQSDFHEDWGMDWLWPRKRSSTLLAVEVPAISPEHILILLCLHGSKHEWSRLIWVCDVAQLLASSPALDWHTTLRDARRFGLSNTLALGVFLAVHLLGVGVPQWIAQRLDRHRPMERLAQHLASNFFDEVRRIPGEETPYHVQLLSLEDRVRWWWRQSPLRPNQKDRNMVQIPKTLDFLYYIIRPLRVVLDYWRRDY